jgi:hypothetical protein
MGSPLEFIRPEHGIAQVNEEKGGDAARQQKIHGKNSFGLLGKAALRLRSFLKLRLRAVSFS